MNLGLWTALHYKYMGGITPSELRFIFSLLVSLLNHGRQVGQAYIYSTRRKKKTGSPSSLYQI